MDKEKLIAIAKRAGWTFLQAFLATFLASVREGQAFSEVNWKMIFEVGIVSGLISVAKSWFVGVPEIKKPDGEMVINTTDPEKDVYRINVDAPLETLGEKKDIHLRVINEDEQ